MAEGKRMDRNELDLAADGAEFYLVKSRPGTDCHNREQRGDLLYGQMRALRMAYQNGRMQKTWQGCAVGLVQDFLQLDSAERVQAFLSQEVGAFIARNLPFAGTRWHKVGSKGPTAQISIAGFAGAEVQMLLDRLSELAKTDADESSGKGLPQARITVLTGPEDTGDKEYLTLLICGPGGTLEAHMRVSGCEVPPGEFFGPSRTEGFLMELVEYSRPVTLADLYGSSAKWMAARLLTRNFEETVPKVPDCRYGVPETWAKAGSAIAQKAGVYAEEMGKLLAMV